uniref:Uncharacterized protein n=1 Tax=Branchiostoma floridae TaxID=7739 RepID=C3XQ52_BRAFL|eukprot:XP_002614064.1 hypothetical protein BRAFLDRAFT_67350 [Branchiostoma floridae]
MAEDNISPDDVPTIDTNVVSAVGLPQVTSNPPIQKDLDPYAFSTVLPNPMYETTSCSPFGNDAERSVPVEDSTTVPETRYVQNTHEKLTNQKNYEKDGHRSTQIGCNEHDDDNHMPDTTEDADDTAQAIEIADDDVKPITEQNIRQNDIEASKSNIHPTSPEKILNPNPLCCSPGPNNQNATRDPACPAKALGQPYSRYATNIRSCNSNNKLYAERNTTSTANNDDCGTNVIPQNDIEDEIQEPIDTDDNDDLDPYMPYAVAYVFPNPTYRSECNSAEYDADNVANGNDDTGLPKNRHFPNTDPSSMQDGLRRNPMYVQNVPQQAHSQCTYSRTGVAVIVTALLVASSAFGTWISFDNNVQKTGEAVYNTSVPCQPAVDSTYTNAQPAVDTPYTNAQPAVDTSYSNGQPAVDTTYTNAQPAVDTTYTNGQPAVDSTYTNAQPAVDTTYTNGQPAVDTTYTNGQPAVDSTYTNAQPAVDTTYTNAETNS